MTWRQVWSLVQQVDNPALGVILDSFHTLALGDDSSGIVDIPGERIFFVQLADAPLLAMDVLQWSRHFRCFPGQGEFDLAGFLAPVRSEESRAGQEGGRTGKSGWRPIH